MQDLIMTTKRKVVVHNDTGLFYGLERGYSAWVDSYEDAISLNIDSDDEKIERYVIRDLPESKDDWTIKTVEVMVFFEE